MANNGAVSVALVREYFLKNGGKVKRHDLFDHFRAQLDEDGDQGKLKNQFGDIVNSLASLQNIEGEKFFVLKKGKNATTPVVLRRPPRQNYLRKEKGASLPATMRNFRFSAIEEASGHLVFGDNRTRGNSLTQGRVGLQSESNRASVLMRRNNSDTSITNYGPSRDSGVDTAASSLQSESPKGSRRASVSRNTEPDRLSQRSGDTGIFTEDDLDQEIQSNMLSGFEKSWMMSAIAGNKSDLVCQLDEEPAIVSFKDFITGYTALHWAAKQGNSDLVRLLAQAGADVNAKSNGGYTPLHLATMHGKVAIINILIDEYHANVRIRDHSGREPKDVVQRNSPEQIKQKLKDPAAAIALQEVAKKTQSSSSGKGKPSRMRLGKILARKHNSTNADVNGEVRSKIKRSHSEPQGSQEKRGNIYDVMRSQQVDDDVFDKTSGHRGDVPRILVSKYDGSISEVMGPQEVDDDVIERNFEDRDDVRAFIGSLGYHGDIVGRTGAQDDDETGVELRDITSDENDCGLRSDVHFRPTFFRSKSEPAGSKEALDK